MPGDASLFIGYFYKIGVILAVRIYSNKVIYYFRVQGPF